jgi:erythromycin esterase-like protein
MGMVESQEKNVVTMLQDLLKKGDEIMRKEGLLNGDEYFYTTENAKVVKDSEAYYRNSFSGGAVTWNMRDQHMVETLEHLLKHWEAKCKSAGINKPVRAILWAHNSHLGDARATELGRFEWNLGQLCRERFGRLNTYNIGFTAYNGTVSAAKNWGGARQTMTVNDAIEGSYESFLHQVSAQSGNQLEGKDELKTDFGLLLRSNNEDILKSDPAVVKILGESRRERAIGVQYVKATELQSHYFMCNIPKQFDYLMHIDKTSYLRPLDL